MRWRLLINKAGLRGPCADHKGFTLVEIMVVAAIMSIMAGLMVPMVYKVWESNENTETREKMAELKRAMVGDQQLVQNGIRMHYGFVGDNGDLPFTINDLVSHSGSFANWRGPYLVGAFDPNDYFRDAWGRNLVYTRHDPPISVGGQNLVATLASLGPDGLVGTADDLDENSDPELQILESEVWPTATLQGNLGCVFASTTVSTAELNPTFYARVYAVHNNATGSVEETLNVCIPLVVGIVEEGKSKTVGVLFDGDFAVKLPVGMARVRSSLFPKDDSDCSDTPVAYGRDVVVYISDGLPLVAVNPPTMNHTVPFYVAP